METRVEKTYQKNLMLIKCAKQLLLSIKNEAFDENDQRTRGPNTNRKLGFHTDRCDVISFLCLMPAKSGGENHIVKSQEIYASIKKERPDLLTILQEKFPYKRHVVDRGNTNPYVMQPIFSEKNGYFACSYLRVLIDRADKDEDCPSLTPMQREALDFLENKSRDPIQFVTYAKSYLDFLNLVEKDFDIFLDPTNLKLLQILSGDINNGCSFLDVFILKIISQEKTITIETLERKINEKYSTIRRDTSVGRRRKKSVRSARRWIALRSAYTTIRVHTRKWFRIHRRKHHQVCDSAQS